MKSLIAFAGLLFASGANAEAVYKCFDGKGGVVYQSQSCESAHLKAAGQIQAPPEVPEAEVERARAETERTRARLDAMQKDREEAEEKEKQQEVEERKAQALERQARAAEERVRQAEEAARAPNGIGTPGYVYPPGGPRPMPRPLPIRR